MNKIDIDHLIRSLPKPTEAEQIELDLLSEQVAERMRAERTKESALETLMYLRSKGIGLNTCLALAKRMGDNSTPVTTHTLK